MDVIKLHTCDKIGKQISYASEYGCLAGRVTSNILASLVDTLSYNNFRCSRCTHGPVSHYVTWDSWIRGLISRKTTVQRRGCVVCAVLRSIRHAPNCWWQTTRGFYVHNVDYVVNYDRGCTVGEQVKSLRAIVVYR